MGVTGMKYRRYGKFRLKNHLSNCFVVMFFLLSGIIGITMGKAVISGAVFIGVSIVNVICTLIPYREKFSVNPMSIMFCKGKVIKEIFFPIKMTVIISYADMTTDLAKRVTLVNNTYILKGDWSVSLLEDVAVDQVIEKLHGNGAWRYTNCWVEYLLKQNFIYNFVCNQSMLEEVLCDKNYTLIIPETLLHMIDTKKLKGDIYIDKGF
jgi:hypothetical protein